MMMVLPWGIDRLSSDLILWLPLKCRDIAHTIMDNAMTPENPIQALLFQAFRLYLGVTGIALGIYAMDAAWFGNSIRPDTLASYLVKAAQWFCTRLTPDKAIEWIWGWRL